MSTKVYQLHSLWHAVRPRAGAKDYPSSAGPEGDGPSCRSGILVPGARSAGGPPGSVPDRHHARDARPEMDAHGPPGHRLLSGRLVLVDPEEQSGPASAHALPPAEAARRGRSGDQEPAGGRDPAEELPAVGKGPSGVADTRHPCPIRGPEPSPGRLRGRAPAEPRGGLPDGDGRDAGPLRGRVARPPRVGRRSSAGKCATRRFPDEGGRRRTRSEGPDRREPLTTRSFSQSPGGISTAAERGLTTHGGA